MTVRLTREKVEDIVENCTAMCKNKRTTIWRFAKLIGKLNAAAPGVQHAPIYIEPMEKIKDEQLKHNCGRFDRFMNITEQIRTALQMVDNKS